MIIHRYGRHHYRYRVSVRRVRARVAAPMAATVVAFALAACGGADSVDATPAAVDAAAAPTDELLDASVDASASSATMFSSDGITSITAEFPAEEDPDNYVFSELPQSDAEQWLYESYPELWEEGVRAVGGKYMPSTEPGGAATLGATVQYVDGERYEGTSSVPLGFRGQDPTVIPSDTVQAAISTWANSSQPIGTSGNTGQGGYTVLIGEFPDSSRVTLDIQTWGWGSVQDDMLTMEFGSWEEAWAYVRSGPEVRGRTLYPGELGSISRNEYVGDTSRTLVWDQSSGSWVVAREIVDSR